MGLIRFYKAGTPRPLLGDEAAIRRRYERMRRSVFCSILFGYSFFYVCRLAFSVAKKPMLTDDILDVQQMGNVGLALFFTYAIGKFVNGLLADWSHLGRQIATGLLGSAMLVFLFGFRWPAPWIFVLIWGLNGCFQAMGGAPCGAILAHWFSNRERGRRYSIWSMSHSIGSAFTFAITGMIVGHFGWQYGFWAAGILCAGVAVVLFFTLADRPPVYGLPPIADYKNDHSSSANDAHLTTLEAQRMVLLNPFVWVLGLSSAAMYISRYAMENWGVLYLQEANTYTLTNAAFLFTIAKVVETIGTVLCGFISDYFFGSRRNVTTLIYGLLMISGLAIFLFTPSTRVAELSYDLKPAFEKCTLDESLAQTLQQAGVQVDPARTTIEKSTEKGAEGWRLKGASWLPLVHGYHVFDTGESLIVARQYTFRHLFGASAFGFGLGGMLALLGGLIAIDICPKRASGTAMGAIGIFSYLGASCQERITGVLLKAGESTINGQVTHDFTTVRYFWLGASVLSLLLYCTLWRVKARD